MVGFEPRILASYEQLLANFVYYFSMQSISLSETQCRLVHCAILSRRLNTAYSEVLYLRCTIHNRPHTRILLNFYRILCILFPEQYSHQRPSNCKDMTKSTATGGCQMKRNVSCKTCIHEKVKDELQ